MMDKNKAKQLQTLPPLSREQATVVEHSHDHTISYDVSIKVKGKAGQFLKAINVGQNDKGKLQFKVAGSSANYGVISV